MFYNLVLKVCFSSGMTMTIFPMSNEKLNELYLSRLCLREQLLTFSQECLHFTV